MGLRQPEAPQMPEQPQQGQDPEQLAQSIVEQVNALKGMVEPDVFENFVKQNILGAKQPQEAPQAGPVPIEAGNRGMPAV